MVKNYEKKKKKIGTVISYPEPPNSQRFSFVAIEGVEVKRDTFVEVPINSGTIVARVSNVSKSNRYYTSPETVRFYEGEGKGIDDYFPTKEWENTIGSAEVLGIMKNDGKMESPSYPVSPGEDVFEASPDTLMKFIGIEENGLLIGKLKHHDLDVKLNLTRLFQKHLAILAMSGAGKSHLATVLIEELLDREEGSGRPAVMVIDVHGEYCELGSPPIEPGKTDYSYKVRVIDASEIKIGVPNLDAMQIQSFVEEMSEVQRRELDKVIDKLRIDMNSGLGPYDLEDIISRVEVEEMNRKTKEALVGWLYDLNSLGIFGKYDNPSLSGLLRPGKAVVIDLSSLDHLKRKRIIVSYLLNRAFYLRKTEEIPPTIIFLEESHQFCPEGGRSISKPIVERIAREGRKFCLSLCLISQRPVKLSTTALSQCNTHVILRVTNPNDLKHIGESSEGITKSTLEAITTLQVGEGLIVGEAVNYPIFVRIRGRKSQEPSVSGKLEDVAKKFELDLLEQEEDVRAFLR